MKRFGLISLLLSCHILLFSKDRSDGRFTFGAEWSYIANIHTGYHYNFFAPEGFRVNPVGNSFGFSSNAEAYLHAGYDFNDDWNLSLYVGYAGIERYHHAVPVSLRATRFFDRNKASDRWFCMIDLGSGICLKKSPQALLAGKLGGGYRVSLSKDASLDFILTLRSTLGHPVIDYYGTPIPMEKTNRNNAYVSSISLGIGLTFK